MEKKPIKAPQCKFMSTDKNIVIIHTVKRGKVYEAGFTIGNQHFTIQERGNKKEAQWFCDMLEKAFETLIYPKYIEQFSSEENRALAIKNLEIKIINKR